MPNGRQHTVLHYTGSVWDGSGIHAVIRQLAQTGACRCILGVTRGYVSERNPPLNAWRGPTIDADSIGLANLWRALLVAVRVRRWLRRSPQRIFHGHSRAGLLVALWLRLLGARHVVVSVHVYGRQRWFYRLTKSLLGRRLAWLTPAMKRYYGYADASWADCLPNGLAAPWVTDLRRWPGGRPLRIGGAGMLVRWKRWDLVLEALARLPADCAVEFSHIGGAVGTPESLICEQELGAFTQSRGLTDRVHWLGWQSSSAQLLRQVDVVVVPSDGEPFSMIALEALFAGVPVIATRGGGPEDFILEGENGWLVPQGDAPALAGRLAKCLDPVAWQSLRLAPEHLRKFSLNETLAVRWAEIYASL